MHFVDFRLRGRTSGYSHLAPRCHWFFFCFFFSFLGSSHRHCVVWTAGTSSSLMRLLSFASVEETTTRWKRWSTCTTSRSPTTPRQIRRTERCEDAWRPMLFFLCFRFLVSEFELSKLLGIRNWECRGIDGCTVKNIWVQKVPFNIWTFYPKLSVSSIWICSCHQDTCDSLSPSTVNDKDG